MDFSRREGHISILDFVIENICKKILLATTLPLPVVRQVALGNGGKILATAL